MTSKNVKLDRGEDRGATKEPDSPITEELDGADCQCNYQGRAYGKGAVICNNRLRMLCTCRGNQGHWVKIGSC